jgi:hypothetical protein
MRNALFDVNKFAIYNRYGRCKGQKDGREEHGEKQSDACHGGKRDAEDFQVVLGSGGRRSTTGRSSEILEPPFIPDEM